MKYMILKDIEEVFNKYKKYILTIGIILILYQLFLILIDMPLPDISRVIDLDIFKINIAYSFLEVTIKLLMMSFYAGFIFMILTSRFKKNLSNVLLRMKKEQFLIFNMISILVISFIIFHILYVVSFHINMFRDIKLYVYLLLNTIDFSVFITNVFLLKKRKVLILYLIIFILFKNNILLNIFIYLCITLFMKIRLEEFGG